MTELNDTDVRGILRPHLDGGWIGRLYATGEISGDTVSVLGLLSTRLDEQLRHEEAERIADVITYVDAAGERPSVRGWVGRL